MNSSSFCNKVEQHILTSCLSSAMDALRICWTMTSTNTEMWPTVWLGAQWPVWTGRYYTHKNTQSRAYADTHTYKLPRVSSVYMHGCFCLFTSDNSCPAYAALLSMCYDSSFGEMVCHFLSSVHRTSVITEARARLFYRTSYEGRSDDCTLLLSACSIFSLSDPFPLFSCRFPPPLLPFFSLSDTLILSLCLLSHTHAWSSHF